MDGKNTVEDNMSDIIERAENWLNTWKEFGSWPIVRGLIDELKTTRAENERLADELRRARGWKFTGASDV